MAPSFHSFMYVLLRLNNLFIFWTQGWSSQYLLNINISLCQNCPWKHICLWSAPGKYCRYFSALCLPYFIKDFFFCLCFENKTLDLQPAEADQEFHNIQAHGVPHWVWHQISHNPQRARRDFLLSIPHSGPRFSLASVPHRVITRIKWVNTYKMFRTVPGT